MSKINTEIAIIGAGPTGLGAAWRLNELGNQNWCLIEGSSRVGGLAGSITDDQGFLWDQGGHVLFSHYNYFDQAVDSCMDGNWIDHIRNTWVWIKDSFIPYPLQNNIWRLPQQDLLNCMAGLLAVHNKITSQPSNDNLEAWSLRHFGQGLSDLFFLPYNFKVWAYEPKQLSASWIQNRVATVDLNRIVRNLIVQEDDFGWGPNATFRYPLHGGTGAIWKRLSEKLPQDKLLLNHQVSQILPKQKELILTNGNIIAYKHLISSAPLHHFLPMLSGFSHVAKFADKLLYSATNLIGIGVEGKVPAQLQSKSWIYFVEDEFPFYRITVFSNYSPNNVPKPGKQWSLLCEISESQHKPVNQKTLTATTLKALSNIGLLSPSSKVVSLWQKRLEYGYPTPFLQRDEILQPIDETLRSFDIYSRGRFGAWKYEVSNQDHSFMQGVEAIDHILSGKSEITYYHPEIVNSSARF